MGLVSRLVKLGYLLQTDLGLQISIGVGYKNHFLLPSLSIKLMILQVLIELIIKGYTLTLFSQPPIT